MEEFDIEKWIEELSIERDKYLRENHGISLKDLDTLSDDEYDELYEKLCIIEVEELAKTEDPEPLTELGQVVADLVGAMGREYIEGGKRCSRGTDDILSQ